MLLMTVNEKTKIEREADQMKKQYQKPNLYYIFKEDKENNPLDPSVWDEIERVLREEIEAQTTRI